MAAKNDITGDALISKTSNAYRDNYDKIFGKKPKEAMTKPDPVIQELDRLIIYYTEKSVNSADAEMQHYYRGCAAALNLFASWVQTYGTN